MVATVRSYASQFGSAPNFNESSGAGRWRVYNYIRSTTANRNAGYETVEAVRSRLAGGRI
jgi:hypothetical protein